MTKDIEKQYAQGSIPKLVLKSAIPSFIMMLVFGLYTYIDSILAVQFAHYSDTSSFGMYLEGVKDYGYSAGDLIRLMMSMSNATIQFASAVTMFFSIGIATRIAVNLGKGEKEKAVNIMRVGTMWSIIVTAISMLVGLLIAETWVSGQFQDPGMRAALADYSVTYAKIVLWATPFLLMNNVFTFVLRTEGNFKAMLVATVLPTLINLLLDYLLMGVAKMGIDGGAWATFTAWAATSGVLIFFAWKDKSTFINIKSMFGKMYHPSIIGIAIIGLPMFFSQFAFSITQTIANNQMGDIADAAYGNLGYLQTISSGVFPIFMLIFPAAMGVVQGSIPIASYNFGMKNSKRVVETVKWTSIISFCIGTATFLIVAVGLGKPLLIWLGGSGDILNEQYKAVLYAATSVLVMSIANGLTVYFGSTDRPVGNLFANTLFGLIFYIPIIIITKYIIVANPEIVNLYWFVYTMSAAFTLITLSLMFTYGRKVGDKKDRKTIDEIIVDMEEKISKRKSSKLK